MDVAASAIACAIGVAGNSSSLPVATAAPKMVDTEP